ncbi:MAG: TlpA family protein disulfide reductase [Rikenellaceae bacterium]|nr:TlpA family protein disulfide reductase [Rikenellaceae bacterium]MCL2692287.1 TlpA family protein disulfide reductase [Rikenellaceae bacterium]
MKKPLLLSLATIIAVAFFVTTACCAGKARETQTPSATLHIGLQLLEGANISLSPDGQLALITRYGEIELHPDENGWAEVIVPLPNGPEYFMLRRNPLYLSPGDELTIILNEDNMQTVIAPEGRGAAANIYLKHRYFAKGGSFLDSGAALRGETRPIEELLDSLAAARIAQLEALQGVTPEFRKIERARVWGDYVNSFYYYPIYSQMSQPDMSREDYNAIIHDYYMRHRERLQTALTHIGSDDRYLDIDVIRRTLYEFGGREGFDVEFSPRLRALYDVAIKAGAIGRNMTAEIYADMLAYAETIAHEDMRQVFMDKLNDAVRLIKGGPAVDVALLTTDGAEIMLSDLMADGRPLYVDVWATWCAPCIAESPHFEALAAEYPEICFVAVSVDNTAEIWRNYLARKTYETPVVQVFSPGDMRKDWNIVGIPRFILIDSNFRIVSVDAPRPSQGVVIRAALDELIGR